MRAPTKTEQILLAIFAVMVLGFLSLLLWGWIQRSLARQKAQEIVLREQISELRRWQSEKELWLERGRWLAANPPEVWQKEESEAAFVQELQRSVAAAGLEILAQRLAGSNSLPGFESVTVQLTVRASTEELVRWLYELQQPGKSLAVQQLNIRADSDGQNLRAEIQLTRYYRTVDVAAPVEEVEPMPASPPSHEQTSSPETSPAQAAEEGQTISESETAARIPMNPPTPIPQNPPPLQPTPEPAPSGPPTAPQTPEDPAEAAIEADAPPAPSLRFDDVYEESRGEEPVAVPSPEVFDLLPVPSTP